MSGEDNLEHICREVRTDIVTMIHKAGSGHPGGSLSAVEIVVTLYFGGFFRCRPDVPNDPARDRFILSKGHAAPMLYSVLAHRGYFPTSELITLRQLGSRLQGHPNMNKLPELDCSSGSLGQGLSIANGLAYTFAFARTLQRVYCLIGDGELQEGQIWEAALFAAQHKLSNICAIVDCNQLQLDGPVKNIKNMEPIGDKWQSFGWHVLTVDGHDIVALAKAYKAASEYIDGPTVILAKTIKGKGISYMENQAKWHGKAPDDEEYAQAMAELSQEVQ